MAQKRSHIPSENLGFKWKFGHFLFSLSSLIRLIYNLSFKYHNRNNYKVRPQNCGFLPVKKAENSSIVKNVLEIMPQHLELNVLASIFEVIDEPTKVYLV